MLHALLRNKLGRLADDDPRLVHGAGDAFARLEDPLTSAVFGRLRYLPVGAWWALLGAAARGAEPWPAAPGGAAEWRFWPSLEPAAGGANALRVEPDVVVVFDARVLVVEAKHHAPQTVTQRTEQLGAVERAWPGRPVTFLAVGGEPLPPHEGAFHAGWGDLVVAARAAAREGSVADERRHALDDLCAAVARWGYRSRSGLAGLVQVAAALRLDAPPDAPPDAPGDPAAASRGLPRLAPRAPRAPPPLPGGPLARSTEVPS